MHAHARVCVCVCMCVCVCVCVCSHVQVCMQVDNFTFTIAVLGVLFYHLGCYLEYKLKIKDTAHVVPVHGVWYAYQNYN